MVTLHDAYAKLSALSEERAKRVIELIEDLAELEARENAEDLAAGKAGLARVAEGEPTYSWEETKKRLDAVQD